MGKSEKQGRSEVLRFSEHIRKRADDLEADIDALFELPLSEFTGARNALATRLKKSGRGDDAALVKAIKKPSISAWAVNQLYWNHRETFDRLIASGERFHKSQTSGKIADMRATLDARREVLSQLSDIAASVLRAAGHNPSLDTIHRITTTLEGISVYAARSDGPRPGRLSNDVDPPGFESFGSFVPSLRSVSRSVGTARGASSAKRKQTSPSASRKISAYDDSVRTIEETSKKKIATAKVSLQDAKRSLTEARVRAQRLEAAQRKADTEAKKAEKHRRDAEEELSKAKAGSEDAAKLAQRVAAELEDAAGTVAEAERTVEKASKELELLLRQSSGR